jgi:uncharacterized DUF497 family protein
MENERFEWDDLKAANTETLRGLSFEYAATIFDDPGALEIPDRRRDYGEERWKLIGRAYDGLILSVIFTERGERIRIISARRATKRERQAYGQENDA